MGFFGGREKKEAARAAAVAEHERLAALALPDLADEVMRRGFGPGGPGEQLEIKVNAAARVEPEVNNFAESRCAAR